MPKSEILVKFVLKEGSEVSDVDSPIIHFAIENEDITRYRIYVNRYIESMPRKEIIAKFVLKEGRDVSDVGSLINRFANENEDIKRYGISIPLEEWN